mmetsp:Transcript_31918/g.88897  ORF Transcript_31918/g.88897 Transcript_31918/m.88897 type:complete len:233 (+) Transcript_31918:238-936(+)
MEVIQLRQPTRRRRGRGRLRTCVGPRRHGRAEISAFAAELRPDGHIASRGTAGLAEGLRLRAGSPGQRGELGRVAQGIAGGAAEPADPHRRGRSGAADGCGTVDPRGLRGGALHVDVGRVANALSAHGGRAEVEMGRRQGTAPPAPPLEAEDESPGGREKALPPLRARRDLPVRWRVDRRARARDRRAWLELRALVEVLDLGGEARHLRLLPKEEVVSDVPLSDGLGVAGAG